MVLPRRDIAFHGILVFLIFQQAEVFRLALKSEDELFHVSLYDWLFSMNMTDKLLEVGLSSV